MKSLTRLIATFTFFGWLGTASVVHAMPVLDVSPGGELLGASGVVVENMIYTVTFLEGTCADVYGSCDSNGIFAFGDEAGSLAASQALLDQVLVDGVAGNFDSNPSLLFSTGDISIATGAFTAYGEFGANGRPMYTNPINYADEALDKVSLSRETFGGGFDVAGDNFGPWARWTKTGNVPTLVPAPGSLVLLMLGLAGFGLRRKARTA